MAFIENENVEVWPWNEWQKQVEGKISEVKEARLLEGSSMCLKLKVAYLGDRLCMA